MEAPLNNVIQRENVEGQEGAVGAKATWQLGQRDVT